MVLKKNIRLEIYDDLSDLYENAARMVASLANNAVESRGVFSVALSGGRTPLPLYKYLAEPTSAARLPWKHIHVFWGDERCVPADSLYNNAYHARRLLLSKVDIPDSNIHPVHTDMEPTQAAADYEHEIRSFFRKGQTRFDLVVLGLGSDGHTASLFPNTTVLDESEAGVRSVQPEVGKISRVTFTAPLINQTQVILFIVTGNEKAAALYGSLYGPYKPQTYPAQLIDPGHGLVYWLVDRHASTHVTQEINPLQNEKRTHRK